MALRNLRVNEDEVLRKHAREVEKFDIRLNNLIDDMIETMYKYNGVGLAAPQVGILKQVVVIDVGDGPIEMINPKIIEQSKWQTGKEGCLSCPDIIGVVKRPYKVTAVAYNRKNEKIEITGEGLLARAICHEIDHLKGVLFKDIATKIMKKEEE